MESRASYCNKTTQIIAKTSTSLQLSVSDMLTHVNFPTFAMADLCYWRDDTSSTAPSKLVPRMCSDVISVLPR